MTSRLLTLLPLLAALILMALADQTLQSITLTDNTDAAAFYNQGVKFSAAQDHVSALIAYLRADTLLPRDVAINDALVRTRFALGSTSPQLSMWYSAFSTLTELLNARELSLVVYLVALVMSMLIIIGRFFLARAAWMQPVSLAFALIAFSAVLILVLRLQLDAQQPLAVTTTRTVLYSGPDASYLPLRTLQTGSEIRVVATQAGWGKALLEDNTSAWLDLGVVTLINSSVAIPH